MNLRLTSNLVIYVGLGIIILIITLFSLLAGGKRKVEPIAESKWQSLVDSLRNDATQRELSARKKEMQWSRSIDSLKAVIDFKPNYEIIYIKLDEKIRTSTDIHTDKQLDSILTNYRYRPISEEGDNKRTESR